MTVKQALQELTKHLPDDCTWDDVMHRIYVRKQIEAGLKDVEEGRFVSEEEIEKEFGRVDHLDGEGADESANDPGIHRP